MACWSSDAMNSAKTSMTSVRAPGSRPLVGSSRTSSIGSRASASARESFEPSPRDNVPTRAPGATRNLFSSSSNNGAFQLGQNGCHRRPGLGSRPFRNHHEVVEHNTHASQVEARPCPPVAKLAHRAFIRTDQTKHGLQQGGLACPILPD